MKAEFSKYGPKHDYRGAHVTLSWQGKDLLGTIKDIYRDPVLCVCVCRVIHMNGEEWPIRPGLGALNILERTYEDSEPYQQGSAHTMSGDTE